ncbi:MAG TPA: tetratricopeptide repeat protein [Acidobacteriaceae bacterium]|nr:tetratricopeptide repeat protein [Acidobacteriaceae bacterium]
MSRSFRWTPLLLAFGVTFTTWGQSGDSGQVSALMRQGAEAMRSGNAASAEAAFRRATIAAPDEASPWLDVGLAELKEGKLAAAMADIRKSLQLDPSSSGAHLFLGIAEYQASHPAEAVADLQLAIQEDSKNEQAYTWLGIVELNTGHPEKAVGPLDRAAELSPTDENVQDYRVQAHLAVAKQSYGQIYKLDPTSWRLHQLNAVIDSQANDHQHAVNEYELAIKLAPGQAALYEALGWEYRALNENALAVKAFTEQLKLAPGNPIAMYNLASSEAENGQPQDALPLLEQVVKMYQIPTQADYYLGRVLMTLGNFSEAAQEFNRSTQLSGEIQLRSWYELSHVYRRLGDNTKAHEAVVKYQELKEQSDQASAKNVQDFLKLNQANAAAAANKDQH